MPYFLSETVDVFPSTYRTHIQSGKLTSENNFVNIINSITDNVGTDGYVLDYSNSTLKLVLHGYYFEVRNFNLSSYSDLWVGINVEQGGYSLVSYDNSSPNDLDRSAASVYYFYGLMYSTTENGFGDSTSNNIYYKLKVVENGKIINKIKFSIDSINYSLNRSLRTEVDSKQYRVTAGDGIETITNTQDGVNTVGLKTVEYNKLTALKNKGVTGKRVYFNDLGIAEESNENKGKFNASSGTSIISQGVYEKDGKIVEGQTFYASIKSPQSGEGNPGDIWFKYVE